MVKCGIKFKIWGTKKNKGKVFIGILHLFLVFVSIFVISVKLLF